MFKALLQTVKGGGVVGLFGDFGDLLGVAYYAACIDGDHAA